MGKGVVVTHQRQALTSAKQANGLMHGKTFKAKMTFRRFEHRWR
jgi:hypothetical protein